jgi:hypothetical protein
MITLAHYSVKEYLISDRIKQSGDQFFAINPTTSHAFIGESCLHYICQLLYYAKHLAGWLADASPSRQCCQVLVYSYKFNAT